MEEYWMGRDGVKRILKDLPSPVRVAIVKTEVLRKVHECATVPPKVLSTAH
jgi:hypothetical protein